MCVCVCVCVDKGQLIWEEKYGHLLMGKLRLRVTPLHFHRGAIDYPNINILYLLIFEYVLNGKCRRGKEGLQV